MVFEAKQGHYFIRLALESLCGFWFIEKIALLKINVHCTVLNNLNKVNSPSYAPLRLKLR